MSKGKRAQYTLEFKIEAVRLVRGGQSVARVGKDRMRKLMALHGIKAKTKRKDPGCACRLRHALLDSPTQFEQRWLADLEKRAA